MTQNVQTPPVNVPSTSTVGSVSTTANQTLDVLTLLMTISMARAQNIESQLVDHANTMQKKNELLAEAQKQLSEARRLRPTKDSDKAGMPADMKKFMNDHGIPISGGDNPSGTDWDKNINSIKSFVDTQNTLSQTDMIQLQSLVQKRDQSFEMVTNLMQQDNRTKNAVIGNIRG